MSIGYLECDDTDEAWGSVDLLGRIREPGDLRGLSRNELTELAHAMRAFLIEKVAVTGGHLGPNLGVVELTIALHRVFHSPRDALLFDTGHQAYPHKILTGRQYAFDRSAHSRRTIGLSVAGRKRPRLGRVFACRPRPFPMLTGWPRHSN